MVTFALVEDPWRACSSSIPRDHMSEGLALSVVFVREPPGMSTPPSARLPA